MKQMALAQGFERYSKTTKRERLSGIPPDRTTCDVFPASTSDYFSSVPSRLVARSWFSRLIWRVTRRTSRMAPTNGAKYILGAWRAA